jgi:regulator of cell morphogenesis and NO signaling
VASTRTLASFVDEQPDAARVLERHRLDYCCGGQQTLADACAVAGVDPQAVLDELAALDSTFDPAPWTTMSAVELVDHLEATHHRYLHEELPRLGALADKVTAVHRDRHPELDAVQSALVAVRDELEPHLAKEERVLFPMIRELTAATDAPQFHCGSLANPIRVMMAEHEQAGDLLAALRGAAGDYQLPGDACASYDGLYRGLEQLEADTHLHIHKENNVLFPAVVVLEAQLGGSGRGGSDTSGAAASAT